ncbi:cyclophilin-like fold protein [uncultured Robinsoniella sp.]|uniref:cyclophilin-like fold protein n=1 Tax=uncultured Robinsoniella sp. TaxID=904190 RepID=UPI00374FCE85
MKKIAALCIGGMLLLSLSAWGSSFKQEPANTDSDPIEQTTFAAETPGTLAYYAPWGNVVLFYGECDGAGGLYELGEAVSGAEQIETLSGEIQIDKVSGE